MPNKPHDFNADPYTSKCMYCGMGRTRHYENMAPKSELGEPKKTFDQTFKAVEVLKEEFFKDE